MNTWYTQILLKYLDFFVAFPIVCHFFGQVVVSVEANVRLNSFYLDIYYKWESIEHSLHVNHIISSSMITLSQKRFPKIASIFEVKWIFSLSNTNYLDWKKKNKDFYFANMKTVDLIRNLHLLSFWLCETTENNAQLYIFH